LKLIVQESAAKDISRSSVCFRKEESRTSTRHDEVLELLRLLFPIRKSDLVLGMVSWRRDGGKDIV
jgi:hypothetical protein